MRRPIRKLAIVEIEHRLHQRIQIVDDSSAIILNPTYIMLGNRTKTQKYIGLWFHEFSLLDIDSGKKTTINTSKTAKLKKNGLTITIRHYLHMTFLPKELARFLDPVYKSLFRFGWNYTFKISKIISVCNYLEKEVEANLSKNGTVVPIGVDTQSVQLQSNLVELNHPAVIIIQNHQIKQKSEPLVSFAEVVARLPHINFYISKGLPENRNNIYYNNVVGALSKLDNIKFVDINIHNKYDYLESADLYVLRSGLDCTPATILEAGLMSKPIIASAVGGVPEMIVNDKTGWAIENSNIDEWVEKIGYLADNPKKALLMGAASKKYVEKNYGIKKISEQIYKEITE